MFRRRRFAFGLAFAALPVVGLLGWLTGATQPTASAQSPIPIMPALPPPSNFPAAPSIVVPASPGHPVAKPTGAKDGSRIELVLRFDKGNDDAIRLLLGEFIENENVLRLDVTEALAGPVAHLNTLLRHVLADPNSPQRLLVFTVLNSEKLELNEQRRDAIRRVVNALVAAGWTGVRYTGPLPRTVTYDLHLIETNDRMEDDKIVPRPAVRNERIVNEESMLVTNRWINLERMFDERYRKHEPKLPAKSMRIAPIGVPSPVEAVAEPVVPSK